MAAFQHLLLVSGGPHLTNADWSLLPDGLHACMFEGASNGFACRLAPENICGQECRLEFIGGSVARPLACQCYPRLLAGTNSKCIGCRRHLRRKPAFWTLKRVCRAVVLTTGPPKNQSQPCGPSTGEGDSSSTGIISIWALEVCAFKRAHGESSWQTSRKALGTGCRSSTLQRTPRAPSSALLTAARFVSGKRHTLWPPAWWLNAPSPTLYQGQ